MDDCVSEGEGAMARWTSVTSSDAHVTPHVTPQSKPCGLSTAPRVPTPICLGLSFHICAMGVTIPALLATRSSCESVGVAAACGKP